jgi:cytochrome c-type biogenesis protein CcmE
MVNFAKKTMKRINIIALALIAVGIVVLSMVAGDLSTYGSFADAMKSGEKVKINGLLAKEKPIEYDPEKNPNYFTFYLKDKEGAEKRVILLASKPQDFERSEQIVLTGQMKGEDFIATDMLLKCPSKYKDEEIYIRSKETASVN